MVQVQSLAQEFPHATGKAKGKKKKKERKKKKSKKIPFHLPMSEVDGSLASLTDTLTLAVACCWIGRSLEIILDIISCSTLGKKLRIPKFS